MHEIGGSDETLERFAAALVQQVREVDEALSAAERHESPPVAASVADELAKLSDLHKNGVLSEDEFNAQKAKLLDRN